MRTGRGRYGQAVNNICNNLHAGSFDSGGIVDDRHRSVSSPVQCCIPRCCLSCSSFAQSMLPRAFKKKNSVILCHCANVNGSCANVHKDATSSKVESTIDGGSGEPLIISP